MSHKDIGSLAQRDEGSGNQDHIIVKGLIICSQMMQYSWLSEGRSMMVIYHVELVFKRQKVTLPWLESRISLLRQWVLSRRDSACAQNLPGLSQYQSHSTLHMTRTAG